MRLLFCVAMGTFFANFVAIYVNCIPVGDSNGTAWDDLDGQMLVYLGRKLHKPLLTLFGMAMDKFHPCSEWTQWSQCVATKLGYFGTKSRQRSCKETFLIDKQETGNVETGKTIENDLGLCEGFCPDDYNISGSGLCIKLYRTEVKQDVAMKQCQQDGGHLMNIDSYVKHEYVKKLLHGINKNIFVDGRRKDVNSAWEFSYGSRERYLEWASGQPDDASISLCLVLDRSDARPLHDIDCNISLYFLCEITVM